MNIFHLYQKKLGDLIPVSQVLHLLESFLEQNSHISFEIKICTNSEVQKTICNLKNKNGRSDKIPVFIHKELKVFISSVICKLFNSTLLYGNFLNILKNADTGVPKDADTFQTLIIKNWITSESFFHTTEVSIKCHFINNFGKTVNLSFNW